MDRSSADVGSPSLQALNDIVPNLFFAVSGSAAPNHERPWAAQTVHPDDEAELAELWSSAREAGQPFRSRLRIWADGGFRATEVRALPLRSASGEVACWIASKVGTPPPEPVARPDAIELLSAVCDTAADAIFVKDTEGRYLYVNPRCARLFGGAAEEIVGTNDDRWFGSSVGDELRAEDRAAIAHGGIAVERALPIAGKPRLFNATKVPFHDPAGRVLGVAGIARDVDAARKQEKAIRDERDMYATMAAVVPGAFVSYRLRTDGRLEIPYATPAIADLFGVTPAELAADARIERERTHPEDRARVEATLARSAADLSPFRCEYRLTHPHRGDLWIEVNAGPLREPDGSILWHGFVLDITERKRVERDLAEERDRIAGIAVSCPGALCAFRRAADGSISFPYASGALAHIYGVSMETIARDAESVLARIHPDDIEKVQQSIDRSAREMTSWRCEFRVRNPMRGDVWVEGHSEPMRDADGGITWNGIVTDITERRAGEARLRASEATLRAVVETVPDFLLLIGEDRKISFINHVAPGLSIDAVLGGDVLGHILPALRDTAERTMEAVFQSGEMQTFETAATTPDGETRWYHTRIGPVVDDGEVIAVTVAATDISARKTAEEQVRRSEERYRRLVDLLPDAVFVNTGGTITFCNAAFVRLMGASSPDKLIGLTPFDVIHPDDHENVRARIAAMISSGAPAPAAEESILALDGTRRRVSVVAAPFPGEEAAAVLVVLHDVTHRQRTEHLLASVLESVSDAILTIDAQGIIRSVNPAATRLFGHAPDALIGRNVSMLMPEPYAHEHDGYLAKHHRMGGVSSIGPGREVLGKRADGSTFPIELSVAGFLLDGAQHFTGVVRDITERKKLEDQFRQAHKMEAFGQLAGGVAHDFNNLLTIILGETELLLSELEPGAPQGESLTAVYEAGQRAAGLTKQLLAFSRRTVLDPRVIDINGVVRETEKMLRRLIGEDIRLTTRLVPNLCHVNVDPSQLGQVLMNMAVNARDAMPKGGTLEIETANVRFDEAAARAHGVPPGDYARLSVRDSGTGMPPDVRERIFQPFFTTKGAGRGTGLGLAVVHGIVTQSGGAISVESEEGRGTTFDLWLPVAGPSVTTSTEQELLVGVAKGALLVVEDDDAVRRLAMRALAAHGYQVLFARDGAEALALIEQRSPGIELLITDVVMPTMGGRELKELVDAKFAGVKVLYVSGYTEDVLTQRGVHSDAADFLAKPYTPSSLLQAVRRALA